MVCASGFECKINLFLVRFCSYSISEAIRSVIKKEPISVNANTPAFPSLSALSARVVPNLKAPRMSI